MIAMHVHHYLFSILLFDLIVSSIGVADALLDCLFGSTDAKKKKASKNSRKPSTKASKMASRGKAAAAAHATQSASSDEDSDEGEEERPVTTALVQLTDAQKVSVSSTIRKISERLPVNLRVPINFMEERKSCTAGTMQHFISIYSLHCFLNILPPHIYEIFALFVKAFNIFVAYELNESELCQAEEDYHHFLKSVADNIPNFRFTINTHLAEHISENIRDFGPSTNSWW